MLEFDPEPLAAAIPEQMLGYVAVSKLDYLAIVGTPV